MAAEDHIHDYDDDYAYEAHLDVLREEAEAEVVAEGGKAIKAAMDEVKVKGKFNRSDTRVLILEGLSQMAKFTVRVSDDSPTSDLNPLLGAICPWPDWPGWGEKGKPSNWVVAVDRMAKDGLLERIWGTNGQCVGYTLTTRGMAYLVKFDEATGADLYSMLRGDVPDTTTNWHWLNAHGHAPEPTPNQYVTDGISKWAVLDYLNHNPNQTIQTLYDGTPAALLGEVAKAIEKKDAAVCFKFLADEHRRALIEDVLIHSNAGNPKVLRTITKDINVGPHKRRVDELVGYYSHESEDAREVITELLCRAAWIVLRRLLDHRTNLRQGRVTRASVKDQPRVIDARGTFGFSTAMERALRLRAESINAPTKALADQLDQALAPARAAAETHRQVRRVIRPPK